MLASSSASTRINKLRAAFGKRSESFYKQVGLRRLRDAKLLYSGNEAYALELLAEASQMLAKAEAFDARS